MRFWKIKKASILSVTRGPLIYFFFLFPSFFSSFFVLPTSSLSPLSISSSWSYQNTTALPPSYLTRQLPELRGGLNPQPQLAGIWLGRGAWGGPDLLDSGSASFSHFWRRSRVVSWPARAPLHNGVFLCKADPNQNEPCFEVTISNLYS